MKKLLKFVMLGPLRKLLAGSIVVTSTSAGTIYTPPSETNFVWSDIRREIESGRESAGVLREVEDVMDLFHSEQIDLATAVRLTYIRVGNRDGLDEFWTDYLTSGDRKIGFERFAALRSEALGANLAAEGDLLSNWLWKAQASDDYDCVAHGGEGNCGVGQGLGGGNGTGNEGNGNGNNGRG